MYLSPSQYVHRAHAPSTPSYFSPTQTTAPFVRVASVLELTCGSNPIVAVSRISRNMKPSMQCQCRARICLYLRFSTLMASKNNIENTEPGWIQTSAFSAVVCVGLIHILLLESSIVILLLRTHFLPKYLNYPTL